MFRTFADLVRLSEDRPDVYFVEVERMAVQDPERFCLFVEYVRTAMAEDIAAEEARPAAKRRHSSITAIILGDVRALEAKRRK